MNSQSVPSWSACVSRRASAARYRTFQWPSLRRFPGSTEVAPGPCQGQMPRPSQALSCRSRADLQSEPASLALRYVHLGERHLINDVLGDLEFLAELIDRRKHVRLYLSQDSTGRCRFRRKTRRRCLGKVQAKLWSNRSPERHYNGSEMAGGDAQRVWFPEMIENLRSTGWRACPSTQSSTCAMTWMRCFNEFDPSATSVPLSLDARVAGMLAKVRMLTSVFVP